MKRIREKRLGQVVDGVQRRQQFAPIGNIKSPEYVKLENEVVEKDKKIRNYESVLSDLDSRLHRLECERDDDFDVDAFNEF